MGFIEKLRQEIANEAQRAEQEAEAKRLRQEAIEKTRLQAEATENERREVRRKLAEAFHEESGVGLVVMEMARILNVSCITRFISGQVEGYSPKDPDSVHDTISWDKRYNSNKLVAVATRKITSHYYEKYIAVETSPDGNIVFHASWLGSTTIPVAKWRNKDKEQIFDKALEKAYRNPGINEHSFQYYPDRGSE